MLAIYNSLALLPANGGVVLAPNASIEVRRESDNALASIFSDANGASALANPFQADAVGRFEFYAAGITGGYKITVSLGGDTVTLRHQAVGTAQQYDMSAFFGDQLLPSANAAEFNTVLGLGTGDTPTFTQVLLTTSPTDPNHAATKTYVDQLSAGLDPKASVRLATTANDSLSGLAARDGITPVAGDRVLVKNQSAPAQNGIYIAASGAWTRATDMDSWAEVPGAFVFVEQGTANADTGWYCTADQGGTLGTTAITWSQFAGLGTWQPLNGNLTSFSGLSGVADRGVYFTAASTLALFTLTSYGRSIVGVANEAAFKALVNLEIGTDVQAFNANLASLAGLSGVADHGMYFTAASTLALFTLSSFGRSLVDDASAIAARTTLDIQECICVAASDETTSITAGTGKVSFVMPYAFTLTEIQASLSTAQASGSIFTVDVNEAGVSVLSTKITIDNTEKTSITAATAPVISDAALAKGSEITVDVDQIGASGAKGLKVYLIGRRNQ